MRHSVECTEGGIYVGALVLNIPATLVAGLLGTVFLDLVVSKKLSSRELYDSYAAVLAVGSVFGSIGTGIVSCFISCAQPNDFDDFMTKSFFSSFFINALGILAMTHIAIADTGSALEETMSEWTIYKALSGYCVFWFVCVMGIAMLALMAACKNKYFENDDVHPFAPPIARAPIARAPIAPAAIAAENPHVYEHAPLPAAHLLYGNHAGVAIPGMAIDPIENAAIAIDGIVLH